MLQKKYTQKNNDTLIDVMLLLKNLWYFKKLVILGTLIATLLALFIIILFNNAPKKHNTSNYISAVLQGDLLENNDRIVAGLKSPEILKNTLKTLGFDLSVYDVLQSIVIQKGTNPLAENLQDYIVNLNVSDVQRLAFSDDVLISVMEKLKNTSNNLISIQFRYNNLNLTELQAKNLIYLLVKDVNSNILLNTDRQTLGIRLININENITINYSEAERLSHLLNISNNVSDNLLKLSNYYSGILIKFDLSRLTYTSKNVQKLLYQISLKNGNSSSIDNIKLQIAEVDRNLYDISNNLSYIDKNQSSKIDYSLSGPDQKPLYQMDNQFFDKILSIGDTLSLSEFRKETLVKQNELQLLKSNLISQIDILRLPFEYDENDLTINSVEKRIYAVAEEVNLAINQVRTSVNPKQVIDFVQNPEIVIIDIFGKTNKDLIKTVITLSFISFLCLSFITFLLNPKSSRRT